MMRYRFVVFCAICLVLIAGCAVIGARKRAVLSGNLKKWHTVTLTFDGPQTGENAESNPFRDYRLNVTFSKGNKRYVVPGYYAADGNAAESGETSGNKWRVHFVPDEEGRWSFRGLLPLRARYRTELRSVCRGGDAFRWRLWKIRGRSYRQDRPGSSG